jgi:hypothetical protein
MKMRVPVGKDGWYLCDWGDAWEEECTEFRGTHTLALQWACQLRGDCFSLGTVRRLIGGTFPPRSDEQIAQELAWRLTSGTWVARRPVIRHEGGGAAPAPVAPAFPREERRAAPPPPAPGPDAPLFPGDIDPEAIADAQRRAAALGVPFCEECLKAQLAGKQS